MCQKEHFSVNNALLVVFVGESPFYLVCLLSLSQIVKRDRKSYIINISKEYSIVSQFTSFVAIEEREKVGRDYTSMFLELLTYTSG